MHYPSKSIFLLLLILMSLVSCNIYLGPENTRIENSTFHQTKSGIQYYYQESTGLLLSETQNTRRVPLDSDAFAKGDYSSYALKVYPKSYLEQWALERMDDIKVSYIPFGFEPVSLYNASIDDVRQSFPLLNEEVGYLVKGEKKNYGQELPETERDVESRLPVLYVEWPKEKPLPEELAYSIEFGLSDGETRYITDPYYYDIVFNTYDSVLDEYVRLNQLKVRIDRGDDVYNYQFTDSKGHITVSDDIVGSTYTTSQFIISVILSSPDWIISRPSYPFSPIGECLGTISSLGLNNRLIQNDTIYVTLSSTTATKEYDILRAVDYYHNSIHDFSSSILTGESQTIFSASASYTPGIYGVTSLFPESNISWVRIYNSPEDIDHTMGVILHEMGHVRKIIAGYTANDEDEEKLLHESYACFIGWHLSRQYYESKGHVFSSEYDRLFFNSQHQQEWIYVDPNPSPYSPLMIDFCDNYNQHTADSAFIDDSISGCNVVTIENYGKISSTLSDFTTYVSNLAGTYFTTTQFNALINYYEPYFNQ